MAQKRDFTDRYLKAIKPAEAGKRVILYDGIVPGFGIRVTDKSTEDDRGSFVLVARYPGSSNPTARRIGDYPIMSLAKGREIAREWREHLRQGVDPKVAEEERQLAERRRRADTFSAAFDAYAEEHLATLRTGTAVRAAVTKQAYPLWGDRPISGIKRADVNEMIRTERKTAPIAANRLLAYLKTFFGWAVDQELIEASPAASVKRPGKETKRDRVLSESEIKAIWQASGSLGNYGRAFRMMLVSAQRRSEVGGMARSEVNRDTRIWRMARERTKNDTAHEVPLSDLAISILDEAPDVANYVFASGRSGIAANGGGPTPLSGWTKAKTRLDELALVNEEPIADWHLHDLRRTAATFMAKLGVDRIVIAKVLNHTEGSVTAIYDRHRYEDQKRQALNLWAYRLALITGHEVTALPPLPPLEPSPDQYDLAMDRAVETLNKAHEGK